MSTQGLNPMKTRRFSDAEIEAILHEAESRPVGDVCRAHKITGRQFYQWKVERAARGSSSTSDLQSLEEQNERLRKLLAATLEERSVLRSAVAALDPRGKG
jgi:putative transposase